MRLIDAGDTIQEIALNFSKKWNSFSKSSAAIEATAKAIHCIENMPSIDAVPVVRCKDCNHYDDGLCRRWIYAHVTNEDSFCSGAERKEE